MPTSSTTAPTPRRAKWSSPIAVVISKNVEPAFVLAEVVAFEPIDGLAHLVDQRDHLGRRRRLAVDRESLLQAMQVRRGVEPRPHARGRQRRGHHRGRRALALGARDVDDRQPGMRIAQPAEQPPHPAELQLGRDPGHAQPLVIEPAVQVFEAFLIVGQHGGSLAYDSLPGPDFRRGSMRELEAGTRPRSPRMTGHGPAAHLAIRVGFDRVSPGAPAGSARGPVSRWIRAELDQRKILGPVVIHAQGKPLQARVGVARGARARRPSPPPTSTTGRDARAPPGR